MYQAPAVDGDIEDEVGIVAYRLVVDRFEVLGRFDAGILFGVVEPAGADGDVRLCRPVDIASFYAFLQEGDGCVGVGVALFGVEGSPVGSGGIAPFVAYPSQVGVPGAEDNGIGLEFVDYGAEACPVVLLVFFGVIAVAVGPIEPHFKNRAVVAEQFAELVFEIGVIGGIIFSVERVVAVPGGDIDAHFEAVFAAGVGQVAQQVAFTLFPGAGSHVVGRIGGGPEAEPIVVFDGEDDPFHTRRFGDAGPLSAIELGRVEQGGVFGPFSPFQVGKRIDAKMDKGVVFHIVPGPLLRRGHGAERLVLCEKGGHGEGENEQ